MTEGVALRTLRASEGADGGAVRPGSLSGTRVYAGLSVGPQTTTVTSSILLSARAHNAPNDIGGALLQGQCLDLQVLEGERMAVNQLRARIVADLRHQNLIQWDLVEVAQRRFAGVSMAHLNLQASDAMVQFHHPDLDPPRRLGRACADDDG